MVNTKGGQSGPNTQTTAADTPENTQAGSVEESNAALGDASTPPAEELAAEAKSPEQLLQEQVINLTQQLEEANNDRLRAIAEADNALKRVDRELTQARKYVLQGFCEALLPILDDLDRALAWSDKGAADSVIEGIELTRKNFLETLVRFKVSQVTAEPGGVFDASCHEAVASVPDGEKEANIIIEVLEKGYILNERLVRPARVVVSRKP